MILNIVIGIAVLVVLYYLFPLIQVVGDSMYPTYKDGEIIVGTRLYLKSNLKYDDVILYRSPVDGKVVIKRVCLIKKDKNKLYFYCLGDNLDFSNDSRNYGFVSSKNIICKVLNQRGNKNDVYSQKRWDS